MLWIVSMVFAACVCGFVFFVGRALRAENGAKGWGADSGLLLMLGSVVLFVVWAGGHTAFASIRLVEEGDVVTVFQFGEVVGQRGEGLNLIAPWRDTLTESIDVRRRQFVNIHGRTKDMQEVCITATLKYSVSAETVPELYRTVGGDWFNKLIPPRVNQFFKQEAALHEMVDIAPSPETIRGNVRTRLTDDLAQFSIVVVDLLIDDIQFNDECP